MPRNTVGQIIPISYLRGKLAVGVKRFFDFVFFRHHVSVKPLGLEQAKHHAISFLEPTGLLGMIQVFRAVRCARFRTTR